VAADPNDALQAEELTEIIRGIRERVRARYPGGATPDEFRVPLPDLLPLLHAREAAESKVASIGRVNPRRGGPLNALIQLAKRITARALDWHVREQVEFNRHVVGCVQAALDALNEYNRSLILLSGRLSEIEALRRQSDRQAEESQDMRAHWIEWRKEWEHKLVVNETQFLRAVADLQAAFQHRVTLAESNFRDQVKAQHADYLGALDRATADLQRRFWSEVEKVQREYERMIHEELRVVRQRMAQARGAPAPAAPGFDSSRFAERFRGPEDYVRKSIQVYLPRFQGRRRVLDLGCGRGEFLEMMREAGSSARGVDLREECVAQCRARGLDAVQGDLFGYLAGLADGSLDGIFCAQVIEHIEPARLPELVRLCAARLDRGGLVTFETPNPECLAIFASHFFLDPTHTRPVPPPLLVFLMEENGLGRLEVLRLSPAVDSMPALASLPEDFRNAFFGGLDYAVLGVKL